MHIKLCASKSRSTTTDGKQPLNSICYLLRYKMSLNRTTYVSGVKFLQMMSLLNESDLSKHLLCENLLKYLSSNKPLSTDVSLYVKGITMVLSNKPSDQLTETALKVVCKLARPERLTNDFSTECQELISWIVRLEYGYGGKVVTIINSLWNIVPAAVETIILNKGQQVSSYVAKEIFPRLVSGKVKLSSKTAISQVVEMLMVVSSDMRLKPIEVLERYDDRLSPEVAKALRDALLSITKSAVIVTQVDTSKESPTKATALEMVLKPEPVSPNHVTCYEPHLNQFDVTSTNVSSPSTPLKAGTNKEVPHESSSFDVHAELPDNSSQESSTSSDSSFHDSEYTPTQLVLPLYKSSSRSKQSKGTIKGVRRSNRLLNRKLKKKRFTKFTFQRYVKRYRRVYNRGCLEPCYHIGAKNVYIIVDDCSSVDPINDNPDNSRSLPISRVSQTLMISSSTRRMGID
ncbi:hypothetical protein DIRU0_B09780 [Diutina rugosa]